MGKSEKKRDVLKAPCKDCPERAVGCHSTCEKYLEYQRKKKEIHDYTDPYVDYMRKRLQSKRRDKWLNGR